MNILKMRKNASRHHPDNAEKSFDPLEWNYEDQVQEFFRAFSRKMQVKHGKKLKSISTFESTDFAHNKVRIQVVAKLW